MKDNLTFFKQHQRFLSILFIIFLSLLMYNIASTKKPLLTLPTQYITILQHQQSRMKQMNFTDKNRDEIKQDIKMLDALRTKTKKALHDAKLYKNSLKTLSSTVDKAVNKVYEAQDHALTVGKFVCKVNTCQGDPKHENYPAFLDATSDLVLAKENLYKANKQYQKAETEIANIQSYVQLLTLYDETLKQLQKAFA